MTEAQALAQASAAAMWAADAASAALGMRIEAVAPGEATMSMTVRDDMTNGHGIAHGAFIAALADSTFAFACNSRGVATVASGFEIEFIEPVRAGDRLVAEAREIVLRGRSGVYDVAVRRGDALVAVFRGRSRTVPAAPGGERA